LFKSQLPTALPERLLHAIAAGKIKTGSVVHLHTSPIAFLREMPVLVGGLVDAFALQVAEFGARRVQSDDQQGGDASTQQEHPTADEESTRYFAAVVESV
jgi:hypothetical protein